MPSEAIREVDGKKKVAAVLLAIVFVSSAGFGLVAKYATENNSNLAKSPAKALGTMDPGAGAEPPPYSAFFNE